MPRQKRQRPTQGDAAPATEVASAVTEKASPEQPAKRQMKRRTPFASGGGRTKLQVMFSDPNFRDKWHPCWMNDSLDTIHRARQGGYEFVAPAEVAGWADVDVHSGNTDLNSKVSRIVGTDDGGNPIRAFLMKISQEWHREDMALLDKESNELEASMRQTEGKFSVENSYGDVRIG